MILDQINKKSIIYKDFYSETFRTKLSNQLYFYSDFINLLLIFFGSIIRGKNIKLLENHIEINSGSNANQSNIPPDSIDKKNFQDLILNSPSEIYLSTSGTTGSPKLIKHTVSSLTRMLKIGDIYSNDRWALLYNAIHIAGIQVIFQAILNENFIINLYNLNILEVSEKIKVYKISNLSATPTFYRMLLSLGGNYEFVKRVTLGGEKVTYDLTENIKKLFPNAKITNIYASTEIGSLLRSNDDIFEIPNYLINKIKIIENELYIHKELVNEENFNFLEDFYPTGDLVDVISENPFKFKFISRKSDIVKVGGVKVNILEVEEKIRELPYILGARVYARKNSVLGNIICSELAVNDKEKISIDGIKNDLNNLLPSYKIPSIIRIVESLKTTKTGKLSRI